MKNIPFNGICIIGSLFLIISSCGLPSYAIVDAPTVTSSDSDTTFKSFIAPADDSNISGYEIYYKIYSSSSSVSIQSDRDKFDENNTSYTYEFGSKKPKSLGFHRLQYGDLTTLDYLPIPLISNDSSQAVNLQPGEEVVINFSTGNGTLTVDGTSAGIPLRYVFDDTYLKPFSSNVVAGDSDSNGVDNGTAYSISFVAFSYVSSIITTYQSSIPVFLGTIKDKSN